MGIIRYFRCIYQDGSYNLESNTNVGESAHANVNHDGRNLSLLAGTFRGRDFDKRQWENVCVYEQYNVPDSYRNKSELARSIQADKRAEKRRKDKQPLKSKVSSASKKQKCNSRNKENENEVIVIDDDNLFDQQVKINKLAQEKLLLQKQTNDELEREIMLLEK